MKKTEDPKIFNVASLLPDLPRKTEDPKDGGAGDGKPVEKNERP